MELTPEQVAMLPPEQQAQVVALREALVSGVSITLVHTSGSIDLFQWFVDLLEIVILPAQH